MAKKWAWRPVEPVGGGGGGTELEASHIGANWWQGVDLVGGHCLWWGEDFMDFHKVQPCT